MRLVILFQRTGVVQRQLADLDLVRHLLQSNPLVPFGRIVRGIVQSIEIQVAVACFAGQAGMGNDLATGQDVEDLERPHQLVRVPGRKLPGLGTLDLRQGLETNVHELFRFRVTAVVLHHFGNPGGHFLPVHSRLSLHECINPGFLSIDLLSAHRRFGRPLGVDRSVISRPPAGRAGL